MRWAYKAVIVMSLSMLGLVGTVVAGDADGPQPAPPRNPLGAAPGPATAPAPATNPAAAEETSRTPLMLAMDQAGLGACLDKLGLKVSAYVEGSYTFNFNNPPGNVNPGRVFDFESNKALMNQSELLLHRDVDTAGKEFDVGFTVELLYGADAGFIHSSGLFDYYADPRSPENQLDLPQAYLSMFVPVGGGLTVNAGKFITPFGQEYVNPTLNTLYSHGYLFDYSSPTSHTGVEGIYKIDDAWSAMLGVARGWSPDETFRDNNGAPDVLGYVAYAPNDQLALQVNVIGGPEQYHNNVDYRYLFEFLANYKPSKDSPWKFAAQADYGFEQNANVYVGGTAYWYGVGLWASYAVNKYLSINTRGEWFEDDGGSRTGLTGNFYEVTAGLGITPLPEDKWLKGLVIRPELRYDISEKAAFNDFTRHDQATFAIDAYLAL